MINPILDGFETKEVTLRVSAGVAAGKAVGLKNAHTSNIPAAGALFCGVCTSTRNIYASVVLRGHTTVKYSGTAPTFGYNKLASDGNGNVRVDENGRYILVTDVDTANQTIDIIL